MVFNAAALVVILAVVVRKANLMTHRTRMSYRLSMVGVGGSSMWYLVNMLLHHQEPSPSGAMLILSVMLWIVADSRRYECGHMRDRV